LPTANGDGNGEPSAPLQLETRIHTRVLPDAILTRLNLLGIMCSAMCGRPPRRRITIVRRVPGVLLVGASTLLVCDLDAQKIQEAAGGGRAMGPGVGGPRPRVPS
jgi:hypothetical protein